MYYLIFSDLHASREGWELLGRQSAFPSARKVCLGDIIVSSKDDVDYYRQVAANVDHILLGNHEAVLIEKCPVKIFNPKVHQATVDVKARLEAGQPQFLNDLRALPIQLILGEAAFAHGSFNPDDPWRHVRYIEDLAAEEPYLPRRINFLGHGHIPFIAWKQDGLWFYERQIYERVFVLDPALTYIINCGSILGSREMRWFERTTVLYDTSGGTAQFINVSKA